jgi:hypothetical protein
MAIYQYTFLVIPNIHINSKTSVTALRNGIGDLSSGVFIQSQKEITSDNKWSRFKLKALPLIIMIDEIMERADGSTDNLYQWKSSNGINEGHDVCLIKDERSGDVAHFRFRINITEPHSISSFLLKILKICRLFDLKVIDENNKALCPHSNELIESILRSGRMDFLLDSHQLIDTV